MIPRRIEVLVRDRLGHMPAVALLGPRQVGKTTLAHAITNGQQSLYLDLESPVIGRSSRTRRCSGCRSCSPPCAG